MDILILGAGNMARQHAINFSAIDGVRIAAVADPSEEAVASFCGEFDVPNAFADLDAALAWGAFDAAANVTPDVLHHATTMALLTAGKHVLCEKPLATNAADAAQMARLADEAGLVNHVNFTYRATGATARARALVAEGALGELRHFEASYRQSWLAGNHWGDWREEPRWLWRLSTGHGSHGAVGDIGVHIVDLLTHIAGSDIARLQCHTATFAKAPDDRVGDYTLDANDTFVMSAELGGGALGTVYATRWATGHANDLAVRLHGTEGALRLDVTSRTERLMLCSGDCVNDQAWREIACPPAPNNYARFAAAVRGEASAGASFREAAEIQKVLDLCLAGDHAGAAMTEVR